MDVPHEQYVTTFNGLPPAIRSYIVDGEANPIVEDIGKKYSFHVDVVGQLQQQTLYMLMGLISPAELLGELVLAGISADVGKSVLQELNERIFIPLREGMKKEAAAPPDTEAGEEVPSDTGPLDVPSTKASPPAITTSSLPAIAPMASVPSLVSDAPAPTPSIAPVEQHARTMADDMALVKDGKLPAVPAPMAPTHSLNPLMPARSFQTASVPTTIAKPVPHASTMIPPEPRESGIESVSAVKAAPHENFSTPIIKEYGADPYREPI